MPSSIDLREAADRNPPHADAVITIELLNLTAGYVVDWQIDEPAPSTVPTA